MARFSDDFCEPYSGDMGPCWVKEPFIVNVKSNRITDDELVLKIAIKKLSEAFDEFIGACLDDGKPKAPDYKAMMKARGYLPTYCKNALAKRKEPT